MAKRSVPDPTPSPKQVPKPAARNRRKPPDPTKLPKSHGVKPAPPPVRKGTTFMDWLKGKGK